MEFRVKEAHIKIGSDGITITTDENIAISSERVPVNFVMGNGKIAERRILMDDELNFRAFNAPIPERKTSNGSPAGECYFIGAQLKYWIFTHKKNNAQDEWIGITEVGRRADVDSSTISKYNNNQRQVTVPVIERIAKVFGVPWEKFLLMGGVLIPDLDGPKKEDVPASAYPPGEPFDPWNGEGRITLEYAGVLERREKGTDHKYSEKECDCKHTYLRERIQPLGTYHEENPPKDIDDFMSISLRGNDA